MVQDRAGEPGFPTRSGPTCAVATRVLVIKAVSATNHFLGNVALLVIQKPAGSSMQQEECRSIE